MKFSVDVLGNNTLKELEEHAKIAVGCTIRFQINGLGRESLFDILRLKDLINNQVDTIRSCEIKGDELVFEVDFGQMDYVETLADIWTEWKCQYNRFQQFFLENIILQEWELELRVSPTSDLLDDLR